LRSPTWHRSHSPSPAHSYSVLTSRQIVSIARCQSSSTALRIHFLRRPLVASSYGVHAICAAT
jgi:hypothetical protein